MNNGLYHPYVNHSGKQVSGAAALNHYIYTVKGSVQNYNDEVGCEYIKAFVKANSDAINANLVDKEKT